MWSWKLSRIIIIAQLKTSVTLEIAYEEGIVEQHFQDGLAIGDDDNSLKTMLFGCGFVLSGQECLWREFLVGAM